MKTATAFLRVSTLAKILALLTVALALASGPRANAQLRISQYPLLSVPQGNDVFLINQWNGTGFTTKAVRFIDLFNTILVGQVEYMTTNVITNSYFYSTNLYAGDTYVNQFFVSNVLAEEWLNEFFRTNVWSTNAYLTVIYPTNVINVDAAVSNYFETNIWTSIDSRISNYFRTNFYAPIFITSNYYTTNFWAGDTYVNNSFTTNLNVKNLTLVQGLYYSTNLWAGPTNTLPLYLPRQWYATYTPISVTGYTGKSNTVTSAVLLTITNASASNVTLYLPGGTMTGNYTNHYTVSNASTAKIWFEYDPGPGDTNAVFRQMK